MFNPYNPQVGVQIRMRAFSCLSGGGCGVLMFHPYDPQVRV